MASHVEVMARAREAHVTAFYVERITFRGSFMGFFLTTSFIYIKCNITYKITYMQPNANKIKRNITTTH